MLEAYQRVGGSWARLIGVLILMVLLNIALIDLVDHPLYWLDQRAGYLCLCRGGNRPVDRSGGGA